MTFRTSAEQSAFEGAFEAFRATLSAHVNTHFFNVQQVPGLIGHFTSAKSAQNILLSQTIWMTNPRCGNDRQEIELAYRSAIEVIESDSPADMASLITWRLTHSGFEHYVSCFTSFYDFNEADNINFWQAYGDDGRGVAVIFDVDKLLTELRYDVGKEYIVSSVTYDVNVLTALARGVIKLAVPLWHAESDQQLKNEYAMCVGATIQKLCAFFKDPCFGYEREVRILRSNIFPDEIEFYDHGDVLTPYVLMRFSPVLPADPALFHVNTTSLAGCLIGPSTDTERLRAIMASTLFSLGIPQPRAMVIPSSRPYRSVRSGI